MATERVRADLVTSGEDGERHVASQRKIYGSPLAVAAH
ncbi:UNVERIFIED_ORG: hypothetical protein GGE44_004267 [Rhizobium esperanzae]